MSRLLVRCALKPSVVKTSTECMKRWAIHTENNVVKLLPSSLNVPQLHKMTLRDIENSAEQEARREDVEFYPLFDERPDKVIGIGLNYKDHQTEQNIPASKSPTEPVIFNKFASTIITDRANIVHPLVTDQLDYEVELAVVIGEQGSRIEEKDAMRHVFGYSVANEVTARDWQKTKNLKQWILGKSMNTFCPMGPGIAIKELIEDPHNLNVTCEVNGDLRQSSNTCNMIFRIPQLISYISKLVTLYPGDIILTGTPSGVGVFRDPPLFLKPGDEVKCYVDKIGSLTNNVVLESHA